MKRFFNICISVSVIQFSSSSLLPRELPPILMLYFWSELSSVTY